MINSKLFFTCPLFVGPPFSHFIKSGLPLWGIVRPSIHNYQWIFWPQRPKLGIIVQGKKADVSARNLKLSKVLDLVNSSENM